MGLQKPPSLAVRDLLDADALRGDLTTLAKATPDPGKLPPDFRRPKFRHPKFRLGKFQCVNS